MNNLILQQVMSPVSAVLYENGWRDTSAQCNCTIGIMPRCNHGAIRSAQRNPHSAIRIAQSAQQNLHSEIRTAQSLQCNLHSAIPTAQFPQRNHPSAIRTAQSEQQNPHDENPSARWNSHDGNSHDGNLHYTIPTMKFAQWYAYNGHDANLEYTMQSHGNPCNPIPRQSARDNPTMRSDDEIRTMESARWNLCIGIRAIESTEWNPYDRIRTMESAQWSPHDGKQDGIRRTEFVQWDPHDKIRILQYNTIPRCNLSM